MTRWFSFKRPNTAANASSKFVLFLAALVFAGIAAQAALAHGPHHAPVRPAYDCFRALNSPDTEGDLVVTYDEYLKANILWKCSCDWIGSLFRCWWREIDRYYIREKALDRLRALADSRYGPVHGEYVRVKWSAWHSSGGCVVHYATRRVVLARRYG